MTKISASTIKSFIICPRQVWYRINAPELAERTESQLIGSIVHEAIERFPFDFNASVEYAATEASRSGLDSVAEERIIRLIKSFFRIKDSLGVKLESGKFEYQFEVRLKGILFNGRFDFVDESSEVVLDWKTSISEPVNLDFDPQFIIYWLAANKIFKKNNFTVLYVSLVHEKLLKYKPNEKVVNVFMNEVVPSFMRSLKHGIFPPLGIYNYQFPCAHCPFRSHCHASLIGSSGHEILTKFS